MLTHEINHKSIHLNYPFLIMTTSYCWSLCSYCIIYLSHDYFVSSSSMWAPWRQRQSLLCLFLYPLSSGGSLRKQEMIWYHEDMGWRGWHRAWTGWTSEILLWQQDEKEGTCWQGRACTVGWGRSPVCGVGMTSMELLNALSKFQENKREGKFYNTFEVEFLRPGD
jgi:hypothetical protein